VGGRIPLSLIERVAAVRNFSLSESISNRPSTWRLWWFSKTIINQIKTRSRPLRGGGWRVRLSPNFAAVLCVYKRARGFLRGKFIYIYISTP